MDSVMLCDEGRLPRKDSHKSKEIAYKSLVRPVMEYDAACWDPYRLEHIKTLLKIQKRAEEREFDYAQCSKHTERNHSCEKFLQVCRELSGYLHFDALFEESGGSDPPPHFSVRSSCARTLPRRVCQLMIRQRILVPKRTEDRVVSSGSYICYVTWIRKQGRTASRLHDVSITRKEVYLAVAPVVSDNNVNRKYLIVSINVFANFRFRTIRFSSARRRSRGTVILSEILQKQSQKTSGLSANDDSGYNCSVNDRRKIRSGSGDRTRVLRSTYQAL
ncbi:hypothetical protein ANN_27354 [Periplaneta americana]|uniref:Uncharacterized protein n=1 Tax=Periplaneta americana TaxID=6978 RepID=A0ABQ8RYC6_PERAM|nr:hypothetical protein ANN_27354 [Periplaneta americana]